MKHGDPEVKTSLDRAGLGTRAATAATMCPCVQAKQLLYYGFIRQFFKSKNLTNLNRNKIEHLYPVG